MMTELMPKAGKEVNKVVMLPIAEILSNRSQPRAHFDADAIQELSRSIALNGLLQPITVRKMPEGGYELIAGERRMMAFRGLGREYIPAIIEEYTDEQSAVFALIENLQRKDLNYFEEAVGIARLIERLGLTQLQVSQRLGKAQSTVANKLRLLRFDMNTRERLLSAGLTERHARALLKLPDINDPEIVSHLIQNNLNVEETERYVRNILREQKQPHPTRLFIIKDVRIFINSINKAVRIMRDAGIEVDARKDETDEQVRITISIPKNSVYRRKRDEGPSSRRLESV